MIFLMSTEYPVLGICYSIFNQSYIEYLFFFNIDIVHIIVLKFCVHTKNKIMIVPLW